MTSRSMPTSRYSKTPRDTVIGITMGDPAGIGAEIIAGALPRIRRLGRIVIIGDAWVFRKSAARFGRGALEGAEFVDLGNVPRAGFRFGAVRADYGRASIEYLDAAMELMRSGKLTCLVTAPISKEAIHRAGYLYSGHTEYLCKQTGAKHVQMMLSNDRLRFVVATRHVPLAKVAGCLTRELISGVSRQACVSLRVLFGLSRVRLAVCGLNPHASDNGTIGREEETIIRPALEALRIPRAVITGPLPADVAVARAYAGEYDCVIAMYHDQALIPLKLTGAQTGVNVTLGLPFVRTSPLHGTAFDIAGRHRACADSFIAAVKCACLCVQNLRKNSARTF